jgi:hypothetical protein
MRFRNSNQVIAIDLVRGCVRFALAPVFVSLVSFVFTRPAAVHAPIAPKRSQLFPNNPKRSQMIPIHFPNVSQMVPNRASNAYADKHTPFSRKISNTCDKNSSCANTRTRRAAKFLSAWPTGDRTCPHKGVIPVPVLSHS